MQTHLYESLGRRALACPCWAWLPGMRALDASGSWFRLEERLRRLHGNWKHAYPDFKDAATIGCLYALVREVVEVHSVSQIKKANGDVRWIAYFNEQTRPYGSTGESREADTEVEALIAVLESVTPGEAAIKHKDLSRRTLAEALVMSPKWRWLEGMKLFSVGTSNGVPFQYDARITLLAEDYAYCNDGIHFQIDRLEDCWPDLNDPATIGCIAYLCGEDASLRKVLDIEYLADRFLRDGAKGA
jgi:hypothetical protein